MSEEPEAHGIRATIEGQALSLYIDYDRSRIEKLSTSGRFEYFRRRFDYTVLEPLGVLLDENDRPRHNREASVLILWGNSLMCAMEALGHFLTPPLVTNAQAFQTFVTAFMDHSWRDRPLNPPAGVDSYCRWLWHSFRNGLAHGAYVKHGGFEKLGGRLFVESPTSGLRVDPWALDIDFRNGFKKMLQTVSQPDNYFHNTFVERFNYTYIQGEA
jgi:hypothetical protein